VHFPRGVHVEEPHLAETRGADERVMPFHEQPERDGLQLRRSQIVFFRLTSAALLDQKCSARNALTGTSPVKEWSLRRRSLESGRVAVADMPSPPRTSPST
jgi:hypothetical protein